MTASDTFHDFNQSPSFDEVDLFNSDAALRDSVARETGDRASEPELSRLGTYLGSREARELGDLANTCPPVLEALTPQGDRLDRVIYHPAYHRFMQLSVSERLHNASWSFEAEVSLAGANADVVRGAKLYLLAQTEPGHVCPMSMTNAAMATLRDHNQSAASWIERLRTDRYDPTDAPVAAKRGVTLGMAMTERQGGSDVQSNQTEAVAVSRSGAGERYRLRGHKWFMSAPMSDGFLVLAQAPGGLTCFLLPRLRDDGAPNGLHFQRLKDKLGNRANGSSEVEFHDAEAMALGDEGAGTRTILAAVSRTRLDCALSSAGLMRGALAHAIHNAAHRKTFGERLVDHPLMAQVLAELAVDVEAATALSLRLAAAFGDAAKSREAAWVRLMTPVTKYWVCKMAPTVIAEAMECLGGNGYVENFRIARLYREAPVNAIWEGSGNIMCLDVIRVLKREPEAVEQVFDILAGAAQGDRKLTDQLDHVQSHLHRPRDIERNARAFVDGLARLAAACVLRAGAPAAVADAFIECRISGEPRHTYGGGLLSVDARPLLRRASPGPLSNTD